MPLSQRGRGGLRADGGRLLRLLVDETAAALELPPRGAGDAAAVPPAEVHPSVAAGVKDEGEATGTGGYDDDLLDPAAAAAREAELDRPLEEQLASEKGR